MKINKLIYTGIGQGTSVLLYPSMVSVDIGPDKPYIFSDNFNPSRVAKEYYESLRYAKLVEEVIDEELDVENDNSIDNAQEELLKNDQIGNDIEEIEDLQKDEQTVTEDTNQNQVTNEEEITNEVFISDDELSEFLDTEYDIDSLKKLADSLNVKYRSNSTKSNIISKLVLDCREDILALSNK